MNNIPEEKYCTCLADKTTGNTMVKCCNICGKPLESENWQINITNFKKRFDFEIYKLLYWIFIRQGRNYIFSMLKQEQNKLSKSPKKKKIYTVSQIQEIVSEWANVSIEMINKNTRERKIVELRQITMYLAKNNTIGSLAGIGSQCGGKDHATVMHACKTVSNLIETNREYLEKYSELFKQYPCTKL